jgi:hypothetical protein
MGKAPYLHKSEAILVRLSVLPVCDVRNAVAARLPDLVRVILFEGEAVFVLLGPLVFVFE